MIMVSKIQENKEGLELLKTAIEKAGYTGKVSISITFLSHTPPFFGFIAAVR